MAEQYDFKQISNIMFVDKHLYSEIDDSSKEKSFFVINRKLAFAYPKQAIFLNHKTTDLVLALDLWFMYLKSQRINYVPRWWYSVKANYGKKSSKLNKDHLKIKEDEDLRDEDLFFLQKYFKDDLDYEIKKNKKFE